MDNACTARRVQRLPLRTAHPKTYPESSSDSRYTCAQASPHRKLPRASNIESRRQLIPTRHINGLLLILMHCSFLLRQAPRKNTRKHVQCSAMQLIITIWFAVKLKMQSGSATKLLPGLRVSAKRLPHLSVHRMHRKSVY